MFLFPFDNYCSVGDCSVAGCSIEGASVGADSSADEVDSGWDVTLPLIFNFHLSFILSNKLKF